MKAKVCKRPVREHRKLHRKFELALTLFLPYQFSSLFEISFTSALHTENQVMKFLSFTIHKDSVILSLATQDFLYFTIIFVFFSRFSTNHNAVMSQKDQKQN